MIRLNLIDKENLGSITKRDFAKVAAGAALGVATGAGLALGMSYMEQQALTEVARNTADAVMASESLKYIANEPGAKESIQKASQFPHFAPDYISTMLGVGVASTLGSLLAVKNIHHKIRSDLNEKFNFAWAKEKVTRIVNYVKEKRKDLIERAAEKHPSLAEKVKMGQAVPLAGGLASGVAFGAATYYQTGSVLGALAAPLIGTAVGIKRAGNSSEKAPLEGIIHNYNSALATGVGLGASAIEAASGHGIMGGLVLGGLTAGYIALAKFRADDEEGNALFRDLRRQDRVGYIVVEVGNKGYDVFPADQKLPLCPIPIRGKEEYATREVMKDGKPIKETIQRAVKNKKGEIVRYEPVKRRPWTVPYVKPVLGADGNPVVISNRVQQHQLGDRIDVTGKDSSTVDGRLTFEYQVVSEEGARNAFLKIANLPGQLEETIAGAVKEAYADLSFREFQTYDPNDLVGDINRCLGPNYEGIEIQSIKYIDIQPTGKTKDVIAQEHEATQSGRLAVARQSNLDAEIAAARGYLKKIGYEKPTAQQIQTVVETDRAYTHEQNLDGNVVRIDTSALVSVLERLLGGGNNNLGTAPMGNYDAGEGPTVNAEYKDVSGEKVRVVPGRPDSPLPRNPTPTPRDPFRGYKPNKK